MTNQSSESFALASDDLERLKNLGLIEDYTWEDVAYYTLDQVIQRLTLHFPGGVDLYIEPVHTEHPKCPVLVHHVHEKKVKNEQPDCGSMSSG